MDYYCKGDESNLGGIELALLGESKKITNKIDSFLKEDVEKHMCTRECPCSEISREKLGVEPTNK